MRSKSKAARSLLADMTATTIAAIATPPGSGGIAVLRLSGPDALPLLHKLFRPGKNETPGKPFVFVPRHLHYGSALDCNGDSLDEVLAVFMPGPASFTAEDVGEIHCHGGPGVTAALLEAACRNGARLAAPGEFTRRAFLNGRLDLTQAEAVAELVLAPTREGVRLAKARLEGELGRIVSALRSSIETLNVQITLAIDFSEEEDAQILSSESFFRTLDEARQSISALVKAYKRARLWREGALAVLAGRVNAGKSSLLNALLGRDRAIVSSSPGTTRDYIEESLNLEGLPLRLIDTAGLRQSGDLIENEGMRRSRDLAVQADLLLLVCDLQEHPLPEETEFLRRQWPLAEQGRLALVMNKIDTGKDINTDAKTLARNRALERLRLAAPDGLAAKALCAVENTVPIFAVSAKTGQDLDSLADGMRDILTKTAEQSGDIAPNLRQSQLLEQSLAELDALASGQKAGLPPDILAQHLNEAGRCLDEISGNVDTEAVLDKIFSAFCIGK